MFLPSRCRLFILSRSIAASFSAVIALSIAPIPALAQSQVTQSQVTQSQVTQVTKIQVATIQVTGSTLIPAAEIAAIVAPYENRLLTLAELRPVTEKLTQYYLERGYLTSRAVLIDQTLDSRSNQGSKVQIRVIEGKLERIDVQGNTRLPSSYIRDRLALADHIPLSSTDLENQLRLLKLDPLFSQVEASLKEGTSLGKSVLRVQVTESPVWSGKVTIDNDINPSVGTEKFEISGATQNLTGVGDRLSLSYARSFSGGANLWNLQYQRPLNSMNGTLTAQFAPNQYQITEASLRDLNIIGSSQTYDLTLRQPLVRSPSEEFALSLGLNHRNGETLISTFLANRSTTTALSFGQDYQRRDRTGLWSARSTFTVGLPWPIQEPTRPFILWNGQLQRIQLLSPGQTLIVQASWQLTPNALPAAHQFSLGGVSRLRGYRPGIQSGDLGFTVSLDDQIVVTRDALGNPNFQIVPFLDIGAVKNTRSDLGPDPSFLAGTGVSFRWKPHPRVNLQLDAALPLTQALTGRPDRNNTLQDFALYFSTQYQF